MSILDSLITNREIGAKYNCTDINRVYAALGYISRWLVALGRSCSITVKSFTRTDLPSIGIFNALTDCVQSVIEVIGNEMPYHPDLPQFGTQGGGKDYLTPSDANAYEQALEAMHTGCLTLETYRSYKLEQDNECSLYQYYDCPTEPAISYEIEEGKLYAVYSGSTPEFELAADGDIYLKTLEES